MNKFSAAEHAYSVKSFEAARNLYRLLAEEGDVDSQAFLGWLLMDGDPEFSDLNEAQYWLELAAKNGSSVSNYYMGSLYCKQSKFVEAETWFRSGIRNGNVESKYCLGKLGLSGALTGVLIEESLQLVRDSADSGHVYAKVTYGKHLVRHGRFRQRVSGIGLLAYALVVGIVIAFRNPSDWRLRF